MNLMNERTGEATKGRPRKNNNNEVIVTANGAAPRIPLKNNYEHE